MTRERRLRRTPLWAVFGALLVWAMTTATWAAPWRLKTVTVGPVRTVHTPHGVVLRAQEAVADRVVVQWTPSVQAGAAQAAVARVNGSAGRRVGRRTQVIELPAGTDVVTAAAALRAQTGVTAAAPDLLVYPALVPNDPNYGSQYHLPLIAAPAAWDVTTGSNSVVIAIIDSGVDQDHPDLATKTWINPLETAGNHKDDDGNGYVDDWRGWDFYYDDNDPSPVPNGIDENGKYGPDDNVDHGTLVAGTAAAVGNNGYGVAGVDWGARIMALQVFPDDGAAYLSTVIEAMYYAIENGANIINLSIGTEYDSIFTAPVTDAYNAGVLVVCAGGNSDREFTDDSATWESPVCNDGTDVYSQNHILGVGATDRYDVKSYYSNFDSSSAHFIDVMAPGDSIYGTFVYYPSVSGFSSYFGTMSGTSFSSPIVAGLAALIKGQRPSATPADLIDAICTGADNIDTANPGYVGKLGAGRANCAGALGVTVAPSAPTNFTATDTPDDEGGSITLTWKRSDDDGSGSDTVTGYGVWRRQGSTGSFTQIATLPKGSEGYVDTDVTTGLSYYYKVSVTDGTLTSETSVVGPVQPLNDSPPPTVSGVVAVDRADDSGGAIVVSWNPYVAPADFYALAIYRSTHSFTSVSGLTPIAMLADPTAVSYVDATVSDGVDYYYAVGVRDTAGNETKSLGCYGPVEAYPNTPVSFAAGTYFMATPAAPTDGDPATLFGLTPGSFAYARWSPSSAVYLYDAGARPLADGLKVAVGRGFWVKLPQDVSVMPSGVSAPSGDFDLALTPGWQQIGNPFFSTTNLSEATVTYNGAAMDLESADSSGIMAAYAWVYDRAEGAYVLAYPQLSSTTTVLAPWQGAWVVVYKDCILTLARPVENSSVSATTSSAARTKAVRTADWQVNWSVPVRVSSAGVSDSACYIGTASHKMTGPRPPAIADAPRLSLAAAGTAGTGNYAVSLAQSGQTNIIWNMRVENLHEGQTVSVTTPDLSSLPRGSVALLEDLATGRTVYLRTVRQYSFTPASGETSRSLRLTVSPKSSGMLTVQALTAQTVRSGGATVSFTLSNAATCSVLVMNIAGRTVRILEQEKVRAAGNNSVLWDGRSTAGTLVPAGTYLVRVTANGTSGESVQAMSTLQVQR